MNNFGTIFKTAIYGESHGNGVGVLVDGVPPGLSLTPECFTSDLERRKSGARGTTPRKESDTPSIKSGTFMDKTTGAPILVSFENSNTISGDYKNLTEHPRPGHSDFVAKVKYNDNNDYRGGGHFSARVTLGLVASGVIAKKILGSKVTISSTIVEIGGCSDPAKFEEVVEQAMSERDSVGGVIECRISNIEVGLGSPFFNSIESVISHTVFAVPGVRGIEFGQGFEASRIRGSQHNDMIVSREGATATNNAGGVNGGITNGNDILFRVAIKPTSSISKPQQTYNLENDKIEELVIKGRHDACIALRAGVIIEAAAAIALADMKLIRGCER